MNVTDVGWKFPGTGGSVAVDVLSDGDGAFVPVPYCCGVLAEADG
jgi:hypothetical protein